MIFPFVYKYFFDILTRHVRNPNGTGDGGGLFWSGAKEYEDANAFFMKNAASRFEEKCEKRKMFFRKVKIKVSVVVG